MKLFQICILFMVITISTLACFPAGTLNENLATGGQTYLCLIMSRFNWTETPSNNSKTDSYRRFPSVATADSLSQISIKNCKCLKFYHRNTSFYRFLLFLNFSFKSAWISTNYSTDPVMKSLGIPYTRHQGLAISVASMGILSFQKV
jgi:hypothetical protein